jgi:hypothetical protein
MEGETPHAEMRFGCTGKSFKAANALFNNRDFFQAAALVGFEEIDDRRKHVRRGIFRADTVQACAEGHGGDGLDAATGGSTKGGLKGGLDRGFGQRFFEIWGAGL